MKNYWVYILANHDNQRLYVGVTSNLLKRVWQHKNGMFEGHTKKYNLDKLVYYEHTTQIESAIKREKQLKGWRREKKGMLIETINPDWDDLSGTLSETWVDS